MLGYISLGSEQCLERRVVSFHRVQPRSQCRIATQPCYQCDGSLSIQLIVDIHRQQMIVIYPRSCHIDHILTIIRHAHHPVTHWSVPSGPPFGAGGLSLSFCTPLQIFCQRLTSPSNSAHDCADWHLQKRRRFCVGATLYRHLNQRCTLFRG